MPDDRCRLGSDDVVIGLDLASAEHQVVVLTADGQRLTRFKIPHSRVGLEELLRRTMPAALSRPGGSRVFAFEATGHVWEAVAYILRARGERYVVINPLTTFRVREARQLSREKTDLTDAEQIAELCRTGLVTRTQLEAGPYLALRRAWGEYRRLREERARLKVLVAHQLYGLFPEFLRVWADLLQPGALAVLRTGLTPATMAALSLGEFVARVREHRAGRRVWRFKLAQVHRYAEHTIACPDGVDVLAREVQRAVARMDVLTAQMTAVATEVDALLADLEETPLPADDSWPRLGQRRRTPRPRRGHHEVPAWPPAHQARRHESLAPGHGPDGGPRPDDESPGPRRAPRGHVPGDDLVPAAQSANPGALRSPHPEGRPAAVKDAGARGMHEQALALRLRRHESAGGVPTRSRLAANDVARRVTPGAPARPERGACRPLSWDALLGPARSLPPGTPRSLGH
jgi:transposase